MIENLKTWYFALTSRERVLVSVAGILTAVVVVIFGILLPTMSALEQAESGLDEAVQRRGRIEAAVEAASLQKPAAALPAQADIDLVVTQGAAEKGFDLLKPTNSAPGQVDFRIEQARAPALLAWLSELESQGISVSTITMRSGANGSVTVEAQLRQTAR
jgi:general secretion pathway protein M